MGGERGFTLVETLTAMVLGALTMGGALMALGAAGRADVSAQRSQTMTRKAQAMIEEIRTYDYDSVAMSANASIPSGEQARFGVSQWGKQTFATRLGATNSASEVLVQPSNSPPDESWQGSVVAGPETVTIGDDGAQLDYQVWRYVTWKDGACDGGQCSTATTDTKRLIVGIRPVPRLGERTPPVAWFTSVLVDPTKGAPAVQCQGGDCAVNNPNQAQSFYLYDTPCSVGGRLQQDDASHETHKTALKTSAIGTSSTCINSGSSAPMPDGLGTDLPTRTSGFRHSCEVHVAPATDSCAGVTTWGYGPGGLAIRGSDGCQHEYTPTTLGPSYVHAWATQELKNQSFTISGRVTLDLFMGTFNAAKNTPRGVGTVCATLLERDESKSPSTRDTPIGSFYCSLPLWPIGHDSGGGSPMPDGMEGVHRSCSGSVPVGSGRTILAGPKKRLVVTLSVCNANCVDSNSIAYPPTPSGKNLVLFYDTYEAPSKIIISTPAATLT